MLRLRSLVSQLCAIFPYSCLQFVLGISTGFHIILIAELHKDDSEITTSLDQLSWFSSLDIFKIVGAAFTGLLMHHLGCRPVALLTALLWLGSYLSYHYSTSATIIIVIRALSSLLAIHPLVGAYISEISEPRFRSSFLVMAHITNTVGMFFSLLLGSLMSWRMIVLVDLLFPILTAITVFATPDSPMWLASKGRLDKAEKALCWLRGWVEPQQVQIKFCAIVDGAEISIAKQKQLDTLNFKQRSIEFLRLFSQRSFYLPFGTFALMLTICNLSGMSTIEDYATVIFHQLNSPIEESTATAIMGAVGILGNLIVLLIIHRTGRRKLAFISATVIGLCQATVAIISFLELKDEYLWVPPIAVIVASFANYAGIKTMMFMMIGEIFPSSVRYIATSMSFAVRIIGTSLMNKLYLYMVDAFTVSGVFLFFASMSFASLVTYCFCFPETEGKTLQEIEDQFKGVKKTEETET